MVNLTYGALVPGADENAAPTLNPLGTDVISTINGTSVGESAVAGIHTFTFIH
jgi:hypothetical protein